MEKVSYQLQGQNGGNTYVDTTVHNAPTGQPWRVLSCAVDTVFTSITGTKPDDVGDLATLTLKAGYSIFGEFSQFQLTSGAVVAYF